MIRCENVSFSYPSNSSDTQTAKVGGALKNINCTIEDGSFVLLCGTSGCGKTTLTRLLNGLIPHYYEGVLDGTIIVDGMDYKDMSLFDLSLKVGSVFQNPRSQFFNVDTTSEIAFGCENHGMPEDEIINRVRDVTEWMNITKLIGKSIFSLSGGEKQKIACGSAAAVKPQIYVLDEPSSNLDVYAIEDLKKLLSKLKADGKTVVISEHRLYYLRDLVDRILYLKDGEIRGDYNLSDFLRIPDKQKDIMGLRPMQLEGLKQIEFRQKKNEYSDKLWHMKNFHFSYKQQPEILNIEEMSVEYGSVLAVIGRNGAGKSTFSRCLCGLEKRCQGKVQSEERKYSGKQCLEICYMVMQDVNHQLFTESVLDEVLLSMKREDVEKAEQILKDMDLIQYKNCHPMALSGGQKQRVAIASAMASERPVIIFDEPTSGLDLFHMRQVAESVNRLSSMGKTIFIVTHDPEFILRCCDNIIHMENGNVKENYSLKTNSDRQQHGGHICFPLCHYHGLSIHFDMETASKSLESMLNGFSVDLYELQRKYCESVKPYVIHNEEGLEHIFSELYFVPGEIKPEYYKVKALELLLYLDALHVSDSKEERPYFYKGQVEKVKAIHAHITENYQKHYTMEALAQDYQISLTAMKRCFKEIYGDSMYSYLKRYRMNVAATMLMQNPRQGIAEIAEAVGYESPGKFSAAFRKVMGQTPKEYISPNWNVHS